MMKRNFLILSLVATPLFANAKMHAPFVGTPLPELNDISGPKSDLEAQLNIDFSNIKAQAEAKQESSEQAIENFLKEFNDVKGRLESALDKMNDAKSAEEFDANFHAMEQVIFTPGSAKFGSNPLCSVMEGLSKSDLATLEKNLSDEATKLSLKNCRTKLLAKIETLYATHTVSFEDNNIIRPIPFEEREIDNVTSYLSNQGFNDKEIMLTFDDGPTARVTRPILDALQKAGVKAAFFSTGRMAKQNADVAKEIVEQGHILASHSYYHTLMMGREVNKGKLVYNTFLAEMLGGHYTVY